jgi:putative membrane protein
MRNSAAFAVATLAGAVLVAAASWPPATGTAPLDDAAIVAIFDLANTADIETGTLGAERASRKEVRDYATMLAQVHRDVRRKGRELAQNLGVTPKLPADNTMAKEHAAAMTRLRRLSGPAFDRAFLQHEEQFHRAVLDAVRNTLLPAIQNDELRAFVTSLAPAFEAHRAMAEHLQKRAAQ